MIPRNGIKLLARHLGSQLGTASSDMRRVSQFGCDTLVEFYRGTRWGAVMAARAFWHGLRYGGITQSEVRELALEMRAAYLERRSEQ